MTLFFSLLALIIGFVGGCALMWWYLAPSIPSDSYLVHILYEIGEGLDTEIASDYYRVYDSTEDEAEDTAHNKWLLRVVGDSELNHEIIGSTVIKIY